MKKFFTFCLMVSALFSIDAMAACAGNQQWCSFYANPGGEGCCIPMTEVCGPDSCKTISPITGCEGLACENQLIWTDVTGENYQTRCNRSTDRCEYQCKPNYYKAGGVSFVGSPPNCKACPAHATCTDPDYPPCCDGGYYLIDHNYAETSSGIPITRAKDYECLRCPSIGGVYGETPAACRTDPPTPSFITKCYIPSNTNITVTEGTFQFIQNCNYTEDE